MTPTFRVVTSLLLLTAMVATIAVRSCNEPFTRSQLLSYRSFIAGTVPTDRRRLIQPTLNPFSVRASITNCSGPRASMFGLRGGKNPGPTGIGFGWVAGWSGVTVSTEAEADRANA